jgi:hypothetical protein
LLDAAKLDPELLESLAPTELAVGDAPDRHAYLKSLLDGAEAEFLERLAVPGDDS